MFSSSICFQSCSHDAQLCPPLFVKTWSSVRVLASRVWACRNDHIMVQALHDGAGIVITIMGVNADQVAGLLRLTNGINKTMGFEFIEWVMDAG